jgi:hypothetical protein
VTDPVSKELLDLAHRVAAGDAQVAELLQRAVSRAHALEASLAKSDDERRMLGELEQVPASLMPLTARVEQLEWFARTFLTDWHRGAFNKRRAGDVLEAFDARSES